MSQDLVIRYDERAMVIMDPEQEWVFSADPLGRIAWVYTPAIRYRRSRFDQWYVVRRGRWTYLEPVDPSHIENGVKAWTPTWRRASQQASGQGNLEYALNQWARRFLSFHREDAERFRSVYQNIPILPPDAYQALYIQASQGCPWNRCAFCSFYRDRDYRVPSQDELDRHLASVRSYWGGALESRTGLFLGDANAIAIPTDVLTERLKRIRSVFPESRFRSLHGFADLYSGRKRSKVDFERLHDLGLSRICFGVESGNTELMEKIQKPTTPEEVVHTVRTARAGGLTVSLIFIVGLGGQRHRESHFDDSIELLSQLTLERPDRVYLSPLTLERSLDYRKVADHNDWADLSDEDVDLEMTRWKAAIAKQHPSISVSLYNIQHFAY